MSDFWMLFAGAVCIGMSGVYGAGIGHPPYSFAQNLCGVHCVVCLVGGIALVLQSFRMQIRVLL